MCNNGLHQSAPTIHHVRELKKYMMQRSRHSKKCIMHACIGVYVRLIFTFFTYPFQPRSPATWCCSGSKHKTWVGNLRSCDDLAWISQGCGLSMLSSAKHNRLKCCQVPFLPTPKNSCYVRWMEKLCKCFDKFRKFFTVPGLTFRKQIFWDNSVSERKSKIRLLVECIYCERNEEFNLEPVERCPK